MNNHNGGVSSTPKATPDLMGGASLANKSVRLSEATSADGRWISGMFFSLGHHRVMCTAGADFHAEYADLFWGPLV
jgi:hypothetical protein